MANEKILLVEDDFALAMGTEYTLKTEHSFDSAHFLSGYEGKCSNIHGHRWRVVMEIMDNKLEKEGKKNFSDEIKVELDKVKDSVDFFDHSLIIEKNTLKPKTLEALKEEDFKVIEVDFRPTAENFSKYFYDEFVKKGYKVKSATVYETPNNCATYSEV